MMGGGGAGGTGSGGTVFIPPGQPEVAGQLGTLIAPLLAASADGGAGTPAAAAYPTAETMVSEYLTGRGSSGPAFYNDAMNRAFRPAYETADYGVQLLGRAGQQGDALANLGSAGIPYAQTALQQGFDPGYGQAVSNIQNNPYFQQALDAAVGGAQLGAQGGNYVQNQAGAVGNTVNPLIQSGFDPQSALFNRSRSQLMDQTNAINAMSGLAGTPYGASVASNALGNFDINWQNQQLARQAQASGAAGQAADRSGLLYAMAPGIVASSGAAPSNVYTGQMGQNLAALSARNQGAAQGLANYGTGAGTAGSLFQGSESLPIQTGQAANQFGAAPYNLGSTITSNALAGLNAQTNLGNNRYQLPNQQIGNLLQYLGYGQSASQLSGQLQNQNFNQAAQGIGGLLGGANTLFGGGGGGGLLGGGSGGGGGGLLGGLGGLFGPSAIAEDFGGGGLALGIPDALGLQVAAGEGLGAAGGGGFLSSVLPLALSA
jgi:hypothetical protein